MQTLNYVNKIVSPWLFIVPSFIAAENYSVSSYMYQPVQPMNTSSQQPVDRPSSSSVAAQQSSSSSSLLRQDKLNRSSPDKIKREKNKTAVKKHRQKLNEYLKMAPDNIRSMEEIEKKLDESIQETERHIIVLKNLLAGNDNNYTS